jgi:hypothetical protein
MILVFSTCKKISSQFFDLDIENALAPPPPSKPERGKKTGGAASQMLLRHPSRQKMKEIRSFHLGLIHTLTLFIYAALGLTEGIRLKQEKL